MRTEMHCEIYFVIIIIIIIFMIVIIYSNILVCNWLILQVLTSASNNFSGFQNDVTYHPTIFHIKDKYTLWRSQKQHCLMKRPVILLIKQMHKKNLFIYMNIYNIVSPVKNYSNIGDSYPSQSTVSFDNNNHLYLHNYIST